MVSKLSRIARASEWWEYKLPPLLAIAYATGVSAEKNLYDLAPQFCILLSGIIIGASYVSIINDLTDLKEDEVSGKYNRLANFSRWARIILVLLPVIAGILFVCFFLHDALSRTLYIFCWIAFSLYSIPPFRLKKRGGWGVVADASGAHLFPGLFLLSATAHFIHFEINWFWFCMVGIWSLMYGLRGILWHQFFDRNNDLKAGINTYASKKNPGLFNGPSYLILSTELIALAFILTSVFKPLPVLALLFYLIMLIGYSRVFKLQIIAIVPFPGRSWHFAMSTYYQLLLPVSLLVSSAFNYPQVWLLVAAHGILFPVITWSTIVDSSSFLKAAVKKWVPKF